MKKAPNKVFIIDDDVTFFTSLRHIIEKEAHGIELIQLANYKDFIECSQDKASCQSTLLAVVDKMMGDVDISVEASNMLNDLRIPHIILSSNQVNIEDFKVFKRNKHCLNIFLKASMQSIVFQLVKSIENAKQHILQVNAIENARLTSIAQGVVMGRSGLNQACSEQRIKALGDAEGLNIKETSALILRIHETLNS